MFLFRQANYCLVDSVRFRLQVLTGLLSTWFKCQYHFKSFFNAIQIYPTCVPTSGQTVVSGVVQFSKSMTFCLGSDSCLCSSGVSPWVHKQFYEVAFLSSSPCLPSIFRSPGAFLFSLWPEIQVFIYSLCHTPAATESTSGTKHQRESSKRLCSPHPWDHSSSLGVLGSPLLSLFLLSLQDFLGAGMQTNGKK